MSNQNNNSNETKSNANVNNNVSAKDTKSGGNNQNDFSGALSFAPKMSAILQRQVCLWQLWCFW